MTPAFAPIGAAHHSSPIGEETDARFRPTLTLMTWWTLDTFGGVLELGSELELHVYVIGGCTIAWWTDASGEIVAVPNVGSA